MISEVLVYGWVTLRKRRHSGRNGRLKLYKSMHLCRGLETQRGGHSHRIHFLHLGSTSLQCISCKLINASTHLGDLYLYNLVTSPTGSHSSSKDKTKLAQTSSKLIPCSCSHASCGAFILIVIVKIKKKVKFLYQKSCLVKI